MRTLQVTSPRMTGSRRRLVKVTGSEVFRWRRAAFASNRLGVLRRKDPLRMSRVSAVATALALALAGSAAVADPGTIEQGSTGAPKYGAWGLDLSGRDPSVKAGDDFYRYANGVWDDRAVIPADRTRYGNFDRLTILSENRTRAIIEAAAAGKSADPNAAKIGAAWRAFMDEERIEKLDAEPLAADLAAIRAATTRTDLAALMGGANRGFQSAIFAAGIGADAKNPTRYAVQLGTGGMGLPDRDYYLEAALADKKAKYQAYVATLLRQVNWPDPNGAAKAVVDYETRIAEVSWTRAQRRDRDKTYNPMSLAELQATAPDFPWRPFLAREDLGAVDRFIVTTNTAVPKVAAIYAATPVATLQAWQAFHVVDEAAPYLSRRFVDAHFAFRDHELAGQPEQQPRWKRGVAFVNRVVGESVGRLYVARYFPPSSKATMEALVGDLETAMAARIERLDWMSAPTKAKAEEKLAKLTVKIGYPVKWRDYGAYRVEAADLYGDAARSAAYDWDYDLARLDGPVDKLEWHMTPQTVNAYYNPTNNEIVFPAAVLQPPFFDPNADPAVNFGGIGGLIGHEMTHGIDDQGRPAPVLNGLTGDQRVFLGWAQVWRQKQRPDAAVQQTKSDPHSAARFRVIGPVRNNDGWYAAFDVKPGDKYYLAPDQRVRIW